MALSQEEQDKLKYLFKTYTLERKEHKTILTDFIAEVKQYIKHKQQSCLESAEEFLNQYLDAYLKNSTDIENCTLKVPELKDTESYTKIKVEVNRLKRQVVDTLARIEREAKEAPTPIETPKAEPSKTELKLVSHELPRLESITFDGKDPGAWPCFWDNFVSTIDSNPHVDVAIKFSHLRKALIGDASNCIKGLSTSAANYEQAKKNLEHEYGDKARLKDFFIDKLQNLRAPRDTLSSMKSFYFEIKNGMATLENLGCPAKLLEATLVRSFRKKLPQSYKKLVKKEQNADSEVDCLSMEKFLKVLERGLDVQADDIPSNNTTQRDDTVTSLVAGGSGHSKGHGSAQGQSRSQGQGQTNRQNYCFYHDSTGHSTFNCRKSADERYDIVRKRNACLNCLSLTHFRKDCQSQKRCSNCRGKHHTSVCNKAKQNSSQSSSNTSTASHGGSTSQQANRANTSQKPLNASAKSYSPPTLSATSNSDDTASVVLYKTAIATALAPRGDAPINILFDEGSKRSFVSERFVYNNGLKSIGSENLTIIGFGGHVTKCKLSKVKLIIQTGKGPVEMEALVKRTIVNPINQEDWSRCKDFYHIQNLELANDFADTHFPVDILIGLDFAYEFLMEAFVIGEDGPRAQLSKLGYIPCGPLYPNLYKNTLKTSSGSVIPSFFCHDVENSLFQDGAFRDELIEKSAEYFDRDLLFDDNTDKDNFIEKFTSNITFEDGHYVVPLTWKENHPELPSNLFVARKRLASVRNNLLHLNRFEEYDLQIREQLNRGFIEPIPADQNPWSESDSHFIPHFPVFKESETTPMRIVFAANAGSPSLNDCLATGPCLLENLQEILHRFRFHKFALTGDIEKAFLSLVLREEDRNYTKFIWYENGPDSPMIVYRYRTVLFGPTSSPFALNSTLQFHLKQYEGPSDRNILEDVAKNIYSDNVISGCDTEEDAVNYVQVSRLVLGKGGFNLRRWLSNSSQVMDYAKSKNISASKEFVSVLGIEWEACSDLLKFPIKNLFHEKVTKKTVLSEVASIFDPYGFVSPVVIVGKNFIQGLWKGEFDWKQELPPELRQKWNPIREELQKIPQVKIQRYLHLNRSKPVTLHVFNDAALSMGYGSIAYLVQGEKVVLLGTKSRVIPSGKKVATMTTPRAELLANVLGCLYAQWIEDVYGKVFTIEEVHLWTDSEINMYWIHSTKTLKQFVQNRINKIRAQSKPEQWHHCPTDDNPADIVSRGCTVDALLISSLYWNGPSWLTHPEEWPKWINKKTETVDVLLSETIVRENSPTLWNILNFESIDLQFSSYNKLIEVVAYCFRIFTVFKNVKNNITVDSILLSTLEFMFAERYLLIQIQLRTYPDVVGYLKSGVGKSPAIVRQLDLRLDRDGLIRLGGRLNKSRLLSEDAKNPVLFPKDCKDCPCPITRLLIQGFHFLILHSGAEATAVAIRQRFWIPQIRTQVKSVLRQCVPCRKVEGPPFKVPQSPDLPQFRVDGEIYSAIGIDCSGHLFIKTESGTAKVYICLFTDCLSRHINLELVSDLSAEEFINAFRRHAAVYSIPERCVADNATNFVSGGQEITELVEESEEYMKAQFQNVLLSEEVQSEFTKKRVVFDHIPKRAPWFGGLYERLIGLTKRVLRKTLSKRLLTYSQLLTVLKECQAVLNDRPLTFLSNDPLDLTPICPSELVLGKRVTTLPYRETVSSDPDWGNADTMRYLQKSQQTCLKEFKNQFIAQYLPSLRERHQHDRRDHKTFKETVKKGLVCLIHSDEKRHKWHLGVITDLFRGGDGAVRAVELRTANGVTNRPIAKLYPLEVHEAGEGEMKDNVQKPAMLRRSKRLAARDY